jgi:hypothetical protein
MEEDNVSEDDDIAIIKPNENISTNTTTEETEMI